MSGCTHESVATLVAIVVQPYIITEPSPVKNIIYIAATLIGALICDIDSPYSKLGRRLVIIFFPFYLLQKICSYICKPLFQVIMHKGILHWPLLWIVIFIFGCKYSSGICAIIFRGFFIGIFTHLFLDYLAEGIYLLAPLSFKKSSLLHLQTRGIIDGCLFFGSIYLIIKGI